MDNYDEDDLIPTDFIPVAEAFEIVKSELGITTEGSYRNWRKDHSVKSVWCVRRGDLLAALAESMTKEQSNKSRGTKR